MEDKSERIEFEGGFFTENKGKEWILGRKNETTGEETILLSEDQEMTMGLYVTNIYPEKHLIQVDVDYDINSRTTKSSLYKFNKSNNKLDLVHSSNCSYGDRGCDFEVNDNYIIAHNLNNGGFNTYNKTVLYSYDGDKTVKYVADGTEKYITKNLSKLLKEDNLIENINKKAETIKRIQAIKGKVSGVVKIGVSPYKGLTRKPKER